MKKRHVEIRSLRPGDPLPSGTPRRYRSGQGYIRLRWRIGANQYVETYEHRAVAGLPACHVHHRDSDKTNNDPSNLEALSPAEHARRHAGAKPYRSGFRVPTARRWVEWNGAVGLAAYESRQRRVQQEARRAAFVDRLVELYATGLSTVAVGREVGLSDTNVYRALISRGVEIRPPSSYRTFPLDPDLVRQWHAAGMRAGEMLRRTGAGRARLYRLFEELGLSRFGAGRPPSLTPVGADEEVG